MACIYGDITKIDTTGASEETAKEIKRNEKEIIKGVKASSKLAEHDLKDMDQYKDIIFKVARAKQMDPAVIAGIISRESRAGTLLVDGWGDKGKGNGYGLMQVDKTRHKELKKDWKSEQHITQGTEILIGFIKEIQKKFPSWSKEQQFK
ncbi:lysozyme g-like isoform X2, partial [Clarias magur]